MYDVECIYKIIQCGMNQLKMFLYFLRVSSSAFKILALNKSIFLAYTYLTNNILNLGFDPVFNMD